MRYISDKKVKCGYFLGDAGAYANLKINFSWPYHPIFPKFDVGGWLFIFILEFFHDRFYMR